MRPRDADEMANLFTYLWDRKRTLQELPNTRE